MGGGINILEQILAKTILLTIQQLPHFLNLFIQGGRSTWLHSLYLCVCVSVVNYLSGIVLDAKLVVVHSGLHIVRVGLRRKDSDFKIFCSTNQIRKSTFTLRPGRGSSDCS